MKWNELMKYTLSSQFCAQGFTVPLYCTFKSLTRFCKNRISKSNHMTLCIPPFKVPFKNKVGLIYVWPALQKVRVKSGCTACDFKSSQLVNYASFCYIVYDSLQSKCKGRCIFNVLFSHYLLAICSYRIGFTIY